MGSGKLETFSFVALFAGVGLLLYFVFAPFVEILTFAAVLAVFFYAPYKKLVGMVQGSSSLAALIVVALVLVFLIVPLMLLGWQVFIEAGNLLTSLQGNGTHFLETFQNLLIHPLHRVFPSVSFTGSINQYLGNVVGFVTANLGVLVSGTFAVILQTFLMMLAFFFFLRDGHALVGTLKALSPFQKRHTEEILTHTQDAIESILKGTLLVALIRWVLISIGFYFMGIPNAILWGSVGGVVGAIPGLGTLLVFIPAVLYLYLAGNIAGAVGLGLFGIVVIVLADNILTAYFFGKGLDRIPAILILFSILGGVVYFGPLGFIFGPLILSIFLSMMHIYSATANERHSS